MVHWTQAAEPSHWRRRLIVAVYLACANALICTTAQASRGGVPTHPKILAHVRGISDYSPGLMDTLSWFDAVSTSSVRPADIAWLRAANPHIRIFFRHMPQTIPNWHEGQTFWFPDTAWNLPRLIQFYALQNDWFLYDIHGQRIPEWNDLAANWTRYCPRGTYGTSQGMTIAEWYIDVALPQIAYGSVNPAGWPEAWGWGSQAFDGLAWETFVDCPAVTTAGAFAEADPDRDGLAEGIDAFCWDGGDEDSLSILYREQNDYVHARLRVMHPELVMIASRASDSVKPSWIWEELNGLKLEEWDPYYYDPEDQNPAYKSSWWSWMYGRRMRPQGEGGRLIGDGYHFAEQVMHPFGDDEREGWDVTYIHYYPDAAWHPTPADRLRVLRWGLGTALLGDGYFCYVSVEKIPVWTEEFDWDFGDALGDFTRELVAEDTLYVRLFTKGFTEVNPYNHDLGEIPAQDARFGFWQLPEDLSAVGEGTSSVSLSWTAPGSAGHPVDEVLIRYATFPVTMSNWWDCSVPAGTPPQGAPGTPVEFTVTGLAPATTYYFAARTVVYGRTAAVASENAEATTASAALPDSLPPAVVDDLTVIAAYMDEFELVWSAPGDDGDEGTADRYVLGYLEAESIGDSAAWGRAVQVTSGLPAPGASGTAQSYSLGGLSPGTLYGLSLRAYDEADNPSPLADPPLTATTDAMPPEPDQTPPGAITTLVLEDVASTTADLGWTCTGDDDTLGVAAEFILGWLAGEFIFNEALWASAVQVTDGLPAPDSAGVYVTYRLEGLTPDQAYSITLRARDEAGLLSSLGNVLRLTTPALPDTLAPAAIDDLTPAALYTDGFDLAWTAPGDDGGEGTAGGYVLAYLAGEAISDTAAWNRAVQITSGLPTPAAAGTAQSFRLSGLLPETLYGLGLRAYDEADNESPIADPALLASTLAAPDTIPPGAITNISATEVGTAWAELTWACSGGDEALGEAASFELAWTSGSGPFTETLWEMATRITDGLPQPGSAGVLVSYLLDGLAPEESYAATVRARDAAGLLSALGSTASFVTAAVPDSTAPPDTIAPAAVEDLLAVTEYVDGFDLEWTAPGDNGHAGRAAAYTLAYLAGGAIAGESDWQAATKLTAGLPAPATAGTSESYRLAALQPGTVYGLALRARDGADNESPLAELPLLAMTLEEVVQPPGAVSDLVLEELGATWARVAWICPGEGDPPEIPQGFVLGWTTGSGPFDEELWEQATWVTAGWPEPDSVGARLACTLHDLQPEQSYCVTVRARGAAGLLSPFGGTATFVTEALPDTIAPAAISDLRVSELGTDWARLGWTAVGDDSTAGRASAYLIGMLTGEEVTAETWNAAVLEEFELSEPAETGSAESTLVPDLTRGVNHSIALRALDEAGNLSPLSNAVWATPEIPHVPQPPDSITDLSIDAGDAGWLDLSWIAPAAHEPEGAVARYQVSYARATIHSGNWEESSSDAGPPAPAPPGTRETYRLASLDEGARYWVAVRSCDPAGNWSALSNVVSAVTGQADREPPAPPAAPPTVTLHADDGLIELSWAAAAAGDVVGYHAYLRAEGGGTPERINTELISGTSWSFPIPAGVLQLYVAIAAVDSAGHESSLSPEAELFFEMVSLRGPFPHPIEEEARFELTLPVTAAGTVPVKLQIYSVAGRPVRRLVDEAYPAGHSTWLTWDTRNDEGRRVAPGLYFLRIEIGAERELRRIYVQR